MRPALATVAIANVTLALACRVYDPGLVADGARADAAPSHDGGDAADDLARVDVATDTGPALDVVDEPADGTVVDDAADDAMDVPVDDGADDAGIDAADDAVDDGALDAADARSHEAGGADAARDGGGMDAALDARTDAALDVPHDVVADAPCVPRITINEVRAYGSDGGGSDEFVELYNAATCTASLSGWTLRSRADTMTTPSVVWTGGVSARVGARSWFVVAGTGFSGAFDEQFSAQVPGTGTSIVASGAVGVFDRSGNRVDSVGWSGITGQLVEGTAYAASIAGGRSIARHPDGADTNANATDFTAATSTPRAAN